MVRIVGVGGVPGTGKTHLAFELLDKIRGPFYYCQVNGVVYLHSDAFRLSVLGRYNLQQRGGFQGTDRMSMSIQPQVLQLVRVLARDANWHNVFFEGDRLFNETFIRVVRSLHDTISRFFVLVVTPEVLEQRRQARGGHQAPAFLKGRSTKYQRLVNAGFASTRPHQEKIHTEVLLTEIARFFDGKDTLAIP